MSFFIHPIHGQRPRRLMAASVSLMALAWLAFPSSLQASGSTLCSHGPILQSDLGGDGAWDADRHGPSARTPQLIGSFSFGKLFSPFGRILGNRSRMIQFGAVGCILALYIIWWRK